MLATSWHNPLRHNCCIECAGADVVYKDVVEPLESVSVTITPTDKKDILEFGDIADVSSTSSKHA